jgi:hypothetical protein
MRQAGLIDGTSFLSKDKKDGNAAAPGYAVETPPLGAGSERRDLTWLAERVGSAMAGLFLIREKSSPLI